MFNKGLLGTTVETTKDSSIPEKLIVSGEVIDRWQHTTNNIMNMNILIMAPPRAGKTSIVKSLLISIKNEKPLYILIAPHNTLEDSFLPNVFWIGDKHLEANINTIVKFQKQMTHFYKMGFEFQVLLKLVDTLGVNPESIAHDVLSIEKSCIQKGQQHRYKEYCVEYLRRLLIDSPKGKCQQMFNEQQMHIWKRLKNRPYLVLIFDDMGDISHIKSYNHLCTNFRHLNITLLTLFQYYALICKSARSCASAKIFTDTTMLNWVINNEMLDGDTKEFLELYGHEVIKKSDKYYFLVLPATTPKTHIKVMFTAKVYSISHKLISIIDVGLENVIMNAPSLWDKLSYIADGISNNFIG